MNIETRCKAILLDLGIASAADILKVSPLTGGVSSDIAAIEFNEQIICVKFALEKLKVSEDWFAPINRNAAEYQWLEFASSIVPDSIPTLLGRSEKYNAFAMEYIQADNAYLWKTALLTEQPSQGEAAKVGAALGKIHKASARNASVLNQFQNQQDFNALRLEPYLTFTASKHPDIAKQLHALVNMLQSHEFVLVHGDISPKNILFRSGAPILLDAECATVGDPSFDIAFCLNHLLLKSIHLRQSSHALCAAIREFWAAYTPSVDWESVTELEARVCRLLPALMLARIDGKSPVEYLNKQNKETVRKLSILLIATPLITLAETLNHISTNLENEKPCSQ